MYCLLLCPLLGIPIGLRAFTGIHVKRGKIGEEGKDIIHISFSNFVCMLFVSRFFLKMSACVFVCACVCVRMYVWVFWGDTHKSTRVSGEC